MHYPKCLPYKSDLFYVLLCVILIPLFYLYEVCIVLPTIYREWSVIYCCHIIISGYLMHNIVGNIAIGARGPGTIHRRILPTAKEDWRLCLTCQCMTPPRSWHCTVCNICVLKRDHHCNFFGCCIGYYNYRYFYMFVLHLFLGTLYTFILNMFYLSYYVNWSKSGWLAALKFLFPLATMFVDMNMESVHVLFFIINIIVNIFTGFLLMYYGKLIVRGQITPDLKKHGPIHYNNGWRSNLQDVFGMKWNLAWISPFVNSPMPGDGIEWKSHYTIKVE